MPSDLAHMYFDELMLGAKMTWAPAWDEVVVWEKNRALAGKGPSHWKPWAQSLRGQGGTGKANMPRKLAHSRVAIVIGVTDTPKLTQA